MLREAAVTRLLSPTATGPGTPGETVIEANDPKLLSPTGVGQDVKVFHPELDLAESEQDARRHVTSRLGAWQASEVFLPLESWVGRVSEVLEDGFVARLSSSNIDGEEEAEFDLEEVSNSDLDLVVEGAVFYWNVGYRTDRGGTKARQSLITFRRLPAYTDTSLEEVETETGQIVKELDWLNPDGS